MRTQFTFANRVVRTEQATLCGAFALARRVVRSWKTVSSVVIYGSRREGYPYIGTFTKDTLP